MSNLTNKMPAGETRPGKDLLSPSGLPLSKLLLPDTDVFSMLSKVMDDYAKFFGIERVRSREFRIVNLGSKRTLRANKYLLKQLDRLNKYAKTSDRERFDKLASLLMKSSIVFRLLCLFRVDKIFYKKMRFTKLCREWRKLDLLCRGKSQGYLYKRVLIPKYEGGPPERPLSVPSLSHRIFANMQYTITWIWMRNNSQGQPRLAKWQHGGIPGRGVTTCWKFLLKEVLWNESVKDIFEFDLSKFFDRVNPIVVNQALAKAKVPPMWRNHLMNHYLLARCVNLSKNQMALERDARYPNFLDKPEFATYASWADAVEREGFQTHRTLLDTILRETRGSGPPKEFNLSHEMWGVPQGYSLSPMLSGLAIQHVLSEIRYGYVFKDWMGLPLTEEDFQCDESGNIAPVYDSRRPNHLTQNILMYVDDGILFGESLTSHKLDAFRCAIKQTGTEVNEGKSKFIKRKGQWLVDEFRFLGLTYETKTKMLRASTRKGATMRFPAIDLTQDRVLLSGMSDQIFLEKLENNPVEATFGVGLFDPIVAKMWNDGKAIPTSKDGLDPKILVVHPKSYLGYILWEEDKDTTDFNITNASSKCIHSALSILRHLTGARRHRNKRFAKRLRAFYDARIPK